LECGSRCVIQRNFPAPAWLDLKTFAPQPLNGPERIRFDRSSYAGTVLDELERSFGPAGDW
jgi:hypothetical protein